MKRTRYSLGFVCLILAAYCFLRNASPLWTSNTAGLKALGFSSDSQCLWTYYHDNNKPRPVLVLQRHEKNTGKVVQEHQVTLRVHHQPEYVILSTNQQLAYICIRNAPYDKYNQQDMLLNLTTGAQKELPSSGQHYYSLSPTGQWLLKIEVLNVKGGVSIYDQSGTKLLYALQSESAEGIHCHPSYTVQFSPDESRMATGWYRVDAKGNYLDSEIRLYDTSTWKELSRIKIGDKLSCDVSSLTQDQLLYVCSHLDAAGPGQHNFLYYTMRFSDTLLNHEPPRLIHSGYHRNTAMPNYASGYELIFNQGSDWHAVSHLRVAYQHSWIESLRDRQFLSKAINVLWPRKTTTLEIYQTSTGTLIGRVPIQTDTNYRISPDGQWIAGNIRDQELFSVVSTQPPLRWPGYVLGLAGVVAIFWRNARRKVTPVPAATTSMSTSARLTGSGG